MSQQIKELAEQARGWAEVSYKNQNDQFTSHWDTPIGYTTSQFFEQKFAELIVRECKTALYKQYSNGEFMYLEGCYKAITDHLGISGFEE